MPKSFESIELTMCRNIEEESEESSGNGKSRSNSSSGGPNLGNGIMVYLQAIYVLGMSPHKPNGSWQKPSKSIIQSIAYCCFTALAILHGLELLKHSGYPENGSVFSFIKLGYHISGAWLRVVFIYTCLFKQKHLTMMMETFKEEGTRLNHRMRCVSCFAVGLILISISCAVVGTLFPYQISIDWSFTSVLRRRCFLLSHSILIWSPTQWENSTEESECFRNLDENLSTRNIAFGWIGILSEIFGEIQLSICDYVLLIATLSIFSESRMLNIETPEFPNGDNMLGKEAESEILQQHDRLRKMSAAMDSAFGSLLVCIHTHHMFQFRHFIWRTLQTGAMRTVWYYLRLLRLVLATIAYIIGVYTSYKQEQYLEWLNENYCEDDEVVVGKRTMKVKDLLRISSNHPIGIGSRAFYVNDMFAFKFVSILSSYVIFISEKATA